MAASLRMAVLDDCSPRINPSTASCKEKLELQIPPQVPNCLRAPGITPGFEGDSVAAHLGRIGEKALGQGPRAQQAARQAALETWSGMASDSTAGSFGFK